ncbi:MAG: hypothetical protein JOZ41_01765 [Chloroflexi bacterium]|nr:hypothetical protein [Chloroflexota bacterium]
MQSQGADPPSAVTIRLTPDEALVLFEWIQRLEGQGRLGGTAEHGGEVVAAWALSGALETALAEPFSPDYAELVDAARSRLIAGHDPDPLTN